MVAKKILTPEQKKLRNKKRIENYNPIMAARNALRREFSKSPGVLELMNSPNTKRYIPQFKKNGERCKVDGVEHLCSKCGQWVRSTKDSKVAIDHVLPVVDPEVGYVDLEVYRERLWCPRENLQKLCGVCHQSKTNQEKILRQLTEDMHWVTLLDDVRDRKLLRSSLKRFTRKRLAKLPYSEEFLERLRRLKSWL